MDRKYTFSVIVPVYNTEPWLKQCLESVLFHQDLDDIEVICIDDGSTDASLQILHDLAQKDSRVKVHTQRNSGLSATRNRGLDLACGEYILFLDSDDLISENSFLYLYNEVTGNNLDILYFDAGSIFDNEILAERYKWEVGYYVKKNDYSGIMTGRELFIKIIDNNDLAAPVWLGVIKRSFLLESNIRFYEGVLYEDELFTPLLMLKAGRVSHRNRKIYIHRFRGNSIMTNPVNIENVHGILTVSMELAESLESYKSDEEIYNSLNKRIDYLFNALIVRFNRCSDNEKLKIRYFTEEEKNFFQLVCLKKGYNYTIAITSVL